MGFSFIRVLRSLHVNLIQRVKTAGQRGLNGWWKHKSNKADGFLKRLKNWSNVTIGFTTSIIAHFTLPNFNSCTQPGWEFSSRLQVIQYTSSAFKIILFKYHRTLIKTIRQTQPLTARSLTGHSSVFCKGTRYSGLTLLIWEEDQGEKKVRPFLKVPHGEGTKRHYSIIPYSSTEAVSGPMMVWNPIRQHLHDSMQTRAAPHACTREEHRQPLEV